MSVFTESLKRLYHTGQLSFDSVKHFYATGRISKEEYTYIVNKTE